MATIIYLYFREFKTISLLTEVKQQLNSADFFESITTHLCVERNSKPSLTVINLKKNSTSYTVLGLSCVKLSISHKQT